MKLLVTKIKTVLRIIYTTKNWFKAFLVKLYLISQANVSFRSGASLKINKPSWSYFMSFVNFFRTFPNAKIDGDIAEFTYKDQNIEIKFGKWGPGLVCEVFGRESYGNFINSDDINSRTVVDIGASIGDSTIYFALNGANKVFSFEPFPDFHDLLLDNIKLNNLTNICQAFNKAVGGKKSKVIIDPNYNHMFGADTEDFKKGKEIQVTTLEKLTNELEINNGLLKLDCEGYEYEILRNAPDYIIKRYDVIILEYHKGVQDISNKLKKLGFNVQNTEPVKVKNKFSKNKDEIWKIGFLVANK